MLFSKPKAKEAFSPFCDKSIFTVDKSPYFIYICGVSASETADFQRFGGSMVYKTLPTKETRDVECAFFGKGVNSND